MALTHISSHRHFVALPLAILMLACIAMASRGVSAESEAAKAGRTIVTTDQPQEIGTPLGAYAAIDASSSVTLRADGFSFTLDRGSLLLATAAFAQVEAGCIRASVPAASAYLSRSENGTLTVAAVTGPVLVRLCDARTVFLPLGMQADCAADGTFTRTSIPDEWLAEQASRALSFPTMVSGDSAGSDTNGALRDIADAFGGTGTLPDGTFGSAFSSVSSLCGTDCASLIAVRALQSLGRFGDADRRAIFGILASAASDDELLLALPMTIGGNPAALDDALFPVWTDGMVRLAIRSFDRALPILEASAELPERLIGSYPKQSELWSHAVSAIIRTIRPTVSSDRAAALDAVLRIQNRVSSSSAFVDTASSSSAASQGPMLTAQELKSLTSALLVQTGFMLSSALQVTVNEVASQSVRVSGVYLSEDGHDHEYAFTYVPALRRISQISRDGVLQPNALTEEQLIAFSRHR